jgi:hypothetical protein
LGREDEDVQNAERSEVDGSPARENPPLKKSMRESADAPTLTPPASMSLFRYSPGLILVCIAIADSIRRPDPDLWGHVPFGQAVLRLHRLVLYDPYSYSAAGHYWNNHEWLSEVLMAAVFNHAGVFGLILLKLACTAVVIVALAAALAKTDSSTLIQFAVLIGSAVVIKPQMQFRPQSFTFALLAILILLLTRDAYRREQRLWLAIPILALWANLHGGFFIGIAVLGTYSAVSGLQDIVAGRGFARAVRLAAITVAATVATLATPYGYGTWQAVGHALRNPYTRIVIVEWQPLASAAIEHWQQHSFALSNYDIGIAMMALAAISWALTVEAGDLPLFAVAAVMAIAAFISNRNLPIAMIAIAAPLARHAPRAWRKIVSAGKSAEPPRRSTFANQAILVALSIVIFVQGGFFSRSLTSPDPYPAGACEFMKQHQLRGNIMSTFQWGEYLIWNMAPGSKVFIDGRYDTVFPLEIIYKFALFNFNQPGGAAVLREYPHDFVLVEPDSGARAVMDSQADWKLIYQDAMSRLYARQDSAAAQIAGVPVTGVAQPGRFP